MDGFDRQRPIEAGAALGAASPEAAGYIEQGTPAFLHTLLALFAAGFATYSLLYWVQPLMPIFSADFGVSPAGASLSLSLTTGLLSLSMLVASSLSEIWGRKAMMVGSLLLSGVLTLFCVVAAQWPVLLAARAAMGLTLSGLPAVAMAYVGEEMHPRSMGLAMGLYIGGSGLGGMSGRLVTGVMTDFWGWRSAALTMGVLGLACGLILWRSLPASRHFVAREPRLRALLQAFAAHLRDPALLLLFVEGFLLMGCFVTIYNYVGYRLMAPPFSLSQTFVGLIFAVYLCGIVSSAGMGGLTGRFGRKRILWAGLAIMFAGIALTLSGRLWLIITGIAVLTAGFFGSHAVTSSWVNGRARLARAQASSLYLFAYYLGSSVVGSLGGIFWAGYGWTSVVALTGGLLLVGLAIALGLGRIPDSTA